MALIFMVLPAGVLLSGCTDRGAAENPAQVVVGLEGNPTVLDPRLAQDAYSIRILPLVFEGLIELDRNSEPRPLLAESFEQPDDVTYIFRLRRGRMTPEGTELGAKDVIYTLKSLADPELRSPRRDLWEKIDEIRMLGDFELKIVLKEPHAPFLTELGMGVVPEQAARIGPDFGRKPFGSGPYQVESFEPGAEVVLTPNPNYGGPAPAIKKIVFRVLPDDVTRVLALERGEIDLLQNSVPPDDLALLKKNPKLVVAMEPGVNYTYLGFNLEDPVLGKRGVREAIARAIDREKLSQCLLRNTVTPCSGILPPSHWAYNPDVAGYDYDPALASRLLDQAGYPDPDGPGSLPRFHLVFKTSQNKTRRWVAEAIADQLRQVGIEVEVRSYEWGTFFADVRSGNFQMYSLTWVGTVDPDIYFWAFHSSSFPPGGANRNRYLNPEFDALAEQGRRSVSREERKLIYGRIQRIISYDLPYVSLWHNNNVVARDLRLKGFVIYPGGDYRSLAACTWE